MKLIILCIKTNDYSIAKTDYEKVFYFFLEMFEVVTSQVENIRNFRKKVYT